MPEYSITVSFGGSDKSITIEKVASEIERFCSSERDADSAG